MATNRVHQNSPAKPVPCRIVALQALNFTSPDPLTGLTGLRAVFGKHNLNKATTVLGNVIARACRQIELPETYRTRLIADVVTGKPDVRNAAAQLPQATHDPKPIEENSLPRDGDIGEGCAVLEESCG